MNTKNILFILSLILVSFFNTTTIQAQISSGGNMIVAENGALFIVGKHSFAKGSGFLTPGIIKTSRTGAKGYVNFGKGSSWTGATEGRFVNGYVRVTHNQPFIFPIGDANKYRPVASSGAENTTAAYVSDRLSKAFVNKNNSLSKVTNREYWEVGGDSPITLSFAWGAESNIANMTKGKLEQLTLVGWKNNQWEIIPSMVTSSNQSNSKGNLTTDIDFSKGIISTTKAVVPNDYKYITLGALKGHIETLLPAPKELVSVYPNPVAEDVYVNLENLPTGKGEIRIFNIDGKEMAMRSIDQQSTGVQHFDASNYVNGLYKVYIKVDNKKVSQQFMVGRMY